MPKTRKNALTKHYGGKFGDQFVLRQRGSVSVMSEVPSGRKLDSNGKNSNKRSRKNSDLLQFMPEKPWKSSNSKTLMPLK